MSYSSWQSVRNYFWLGVAILMFPAAILYQQITLSSPVVERALLNGTVIAITGSGEDRWGLPSRYGYQILLTREQEGIMLNSPSLHRIGDQVTVERVMRGNGKETYRLLPASD